MTDRHSSAGTAVPGGRSNAAGFDTSADDVFGRIAERYDLLCDVFSFWIHRYWKRRVAMLVASVRWHQLLDVASGTGDIVLRVLDRQPADSSRRIIASDISPQMLAIAARRLSNVRTHVELRRLDARSLPSIESGTIDLYSISLALKICDRRMVLREALRVLRPGGRMIILEASSIPIGWLNRAYLSYMSVCMPIVGWIATGGDASAYRYLLEGIREFPAAEDLAREMAEVGFTDVSFERLSLGIVAIHVGTKPVLAARGHV